MTKSTHAFAVGRVLLVITAFLALTGPRRLQGQGARAVLVTGASSGIGRAITEHLAATGAFVYAGARTDQDLRALDAIANVKGIRLDVTKQAEIDSAVEIVRRAGRGLFGVVNNAGVAILAPLIETDEADLTFQLDVNLYGPYRITKAFAPLILESKGRIVTIGSLNGILAGPFSGPYAMSKFAMEAFTDALASEMADFGVKVSIVEPGRYRSSMSANVMERWRAKHGTTHGSRFEAQYQQMLASFSPENEARYPVPLDVAKAVEDALFSPRPKLRYLVTPTAGQARSGIRRAMEKVVELNDRQPFALDRSALVALLDSALAR